MASATLPIDEAPVMLSGRLSAPWRRRFIQQATHEVESISLLLQRELQEMDAESAALLGLAIRLETLSGVIFSALGDEMETQESIAARLFGPEMHRVAKRKR